MLKEVGASGQISLGKKYAGQLFEVELLADGSIVMRPMKVVPAATYTAQDTLASYEPTPTPPGQSAKEWVQNHAGDIDQYNAWATQREPYSQRVRRWREQDSHDAQKPTAG